MSSPVKPVLVVGTTPDYVERIADRFDERAFFLSDFDSYRDRGPYSSLRAVQIFSSLRDPDESFSRLQGFISENGIRPGGVACFDCESLLLAADIAKRLSLPFPGGEAVLNSRDKLEARRLWHENGIVCPRAILVRDEGDLSAFIDILRRPVVLKPATLSGSELTFVCSGRDEAFGALRMIREGLRKRGRDRRMNRDRLIEENAVLCEEYIAGDEYSCDFIIDGDDVKIIRTARKYLMDDGPAGTAQAYEVPGMTAQRVGELDLAGRISAAARALGLERCMGMADFIISDGEPYFLEITPRPGGDCLPQVIEHSSGLDILGAHLDYSSGRKLRLPSETEWKHTVGLRIHAGRRGNLTAIRFWADRVSQEILEIGWYREPGDRIGLPPEDYSSWVIGHVIFRPVPGEDIASQIEDMKAAVEVRIE